MSLNRICSFLLERELIIKWTDYLPWKIINFKQLRLSMDPSLFLLLFNVAEKDEDDCVLINNEAFHHFTLTSTRWFSFQYFTSLFAQLFLNWCAMQCKGSDRVFYSNFQLRPIQFHLLFHTFAFSSTLLLLLLLLSCFVW